MIGGFTRLLCVSFVLLPAWWNCLWLTYKIDQTLKWSLHSVNLLAWALNGNCRLKHSIDCSPCLLCPVPLCSTPICIRVKSNFCLQLQFFLIISWYYFKCNWLFCLALEKPNSLLSDYKHVILVKAILPDCCGRWEVRWGCGDGDAAPRFESTCLAVSRWPRWSSSVSTCIWSILHWSAMLSQFSNTFFGVRFKVEPFFFK